MSTSRCSGRRLRTFLCPATIFTKYCIPYFSNAVIHFLLHSFIHRSGWKSGRAGNFERYYRCFLTHYQTSLSVWVQWKVSVMMTHWTDSRVCFGQHSRHAGCSGLQLWYVIRFDSFIKTKCVLWEKKLIAGRILTFLTMKMF